MGLLWGPAWRSSSLPALAYRIKSAGERRAGFGSWVCGGPFETPAGAGPSGGGPTGCLNRGSRAELVEARRRGGGRGKGQGSDGSLPARKGGGAAPAGSGGD